MAGRHAENVWSAREKLYGQVRQLDLLMPETDQPITAPALVQTPAPATEHHPAEATAEADPETPSPDDDLAGPTPADLVAQQLMAARRKAPPLRRPRSSFVHRR
jgi:hypothetical protein